MRSSTLGYTLATTPTKGDAMTTLELITYELRRLHKALDKSLEGLTLEQLHQVPAGHASANTIAWGLWHYARTEDNVIRYILQNRRPIVWVEVGIIPRRGEAFPGDGRSEAAAETRRRPAAERWPGS